MSKKSKKRSKVPISELTPPAKKAITPKGCFLFDSATTIPIYCISDYCQIHGSMSKLGRCSKYVLCPKCGIFYVTRQQYFSNKSRFKLIKAFPGKQTPAVFQSVPRKARADEANNSPREQRQIEMRDYVVRSNIFHCTNNEHKVANITAVVSILTNSGNVIEKKIGACYCQTCNQYYISQSAIETLKRYGIILCRMVDYKDLVSSQNRNNSRNLLFEMRDESVLKQCGYNVSQSEDIPAFIRQAILAMIIDSKIETKSGVEGYLNSFISLRKNRNNFEVAISKWEEDRSFVEQYRVGDFKQYGIKSIRRK